MTTDPPPLQIGTHAVDLPCPRCGSLTLVLVRLQAVLTEATDDTSKLKIRARSQPVDHLCGQTRLALTPDAAGLFDPAV